MPTNRQCVKRWCFTSHEEEKPKGDDDVAFLCYQQEKGKEEGKLHWQGYIEFKARTTMVAAKKLLGNTVHLEAAKGSQAKCVAYCKKEDTAIENTFEQFGELNPVSNGNEWDQVKELAKDSSIPIGDIVERHFGLSVRNFSGLRACISMVRGAGAIRDMQCFVFWGKTGVGKTSLIYKLFGVESVYVKPADKWWDGYNDQKIVLFDDFYGGLPVNMLLRITDRYPVQGEVKGGMAQLRHTTCIFTSNEPPAHWYKDIPQAVRDALTRRLPATNVFELHDNLAHVQDGCFDADEDGSDPAARIRAILAPPAPPAQIGDGF